MDNIIFCCSSYSLRDKKTMPQGHTRILFFSISRHGHKGNQSPMSFNQFREMYKHKATLLQSQEYLRQ
ncbi:hypothetical protein XENTR_v10004379 [Xenopus tropicalis]|nr:hypothetical protein XENTR_v10004379 [Xenopus tropicalis]